MDRIVPTVNPAQPCAVTLGNRHHATTGWPNPCSEKFAYSRERQW